MQNNICFHCKHYKIQLKCEAFLKRIPNEILLGENDHRKPLPGQDNNIVFEKI
jgi:hypothetical protein